MTQFEVQGKEISIESQFEDGRTRFIKTIEEIRQNIDGLDKLTDEEIKSLATPDLKDKLIAFGRYAKGEYFAQGVGISSALIFMASAALTEDGLLNLEKTLVALGIGAGTAAVAGIARWFEDIQKLKFNEDITYGLVGKLMNAAEPKPELEKEGE